MISRTVQHTASSCPHWQGSLVITQDSHGNVFIETEGSHHQKSSKKTQINQTVEIPLKMKCRSSTTASLCMWRGFFCFLRWTHGKDSHEATEQQTSISWKQQFYRIKEHRGSFVSLNQETSVTDAVGHLLVQQSNIQFLRLTASSSPLSAL